MEELEEQVAVEVEQAAQIEQLRNQVQVEMALLAEAEADARVMLLIALLGVLPEAMALAA